MKELFPFARPVLALCLLSVALAQVNVPAELRSQYAVSGLEWEEFVEQLMLGLGVNPEGASAETEVEEPEPFEQPEPGEEPEPTDPPEPTISAQFLNPNSTFMKALVNGSMGVSLEQLAALDEIPPLPATEKPQVLTTIQPNTTANSTKRTTTTADRIHRPPITKNPAEPATNSSSTEVIKNIEAKVPLYHGVLTLHYTSYIEKAANFSNKGNASRTLKGTASFSKQTKPPGISPLKGLTKNIGRISAFNSLESILSKASTGVAIVSSPSSTANRSNITIKFPNSTKTATAPRADSAITSAILATSLNISTESNNTSPTSATESYASSSQIIARNSTESINTSTTSATESNASSSQIIARNSTESNNTSTTSATERNASSSQIPVIARNSTESNNTSITSATESNASSLQIIATKDSVNSASSVATSAPVATSPSIPSVTGNGTTQLDSPTNLPTVTEVTTSKSSLAVGTSTRNSGTIDAGVDKVSAASPTHAATSTTVGSVATSPSSNHDKAAVDQTANFNDLTAVKSASLVNRSGSELSSESLLQTAAGERSTSVLPTSNELLAGETTINVPSAPQGAALHQDPQSALSDLVLPGWRMSQSSASSHRTCQVTLGVLLASCLLYVLS